MYGNLDLETTFSLCDSDGDERERAYAYLTADGEHLKAPCSRYGRDSAECAPVAIAVAAILEAETGEPTTGHELTDIMGMVVNDHEGPAETLNRYGREYGFPPEDYLREEDWSVRTRERVSGEPVRLYVVGHNMAGYLPEGDVWHTTNPEAAKQALLDDLERAGDEAFEAGEHDVADQASHVAEELNLASAAEGWSEEVGDYVYWLYPTTIGEVDPDGDLADLPLEEVLDQLNSIG